jgi:hypothetical protein
MATKYAQKHGLRGFLFNRPYPEMARWKRALLTITGGPAWIFGSRIAWALKNRRHGEEPILRQKVTSAAYGNPIPRIYGRMRTGGQVLWATDIGGLRAVNEFTGQVVEAEGEDTPRFVSLAVGICKGPIDAVLRIWANDLLIFDATGTSTGVNSPTLYIEKTVYLGTEAQTADPWMEAFEGAGEVPGYRGIAYVVFKNFPLASFGDQVPNFEFEVSSSASSLFLQEEVTGSAFPSDNWAMSQIGPYLYGESGGTLNRLNRQTGTLLRQLDVGAVVEAVSATASLYGRLVVDEGTDSFYFLCRDGLRSFIVFYGLFSLANNYTSRTPAHEQAAEVDGIAPRRSDFFFTADDTGAKIRCYRKVGLTRQWKRNGPSATAKPGNFTYDREGALWLISWEDADSTKFYLTRATQGGNVVHYTITGYGRCKWLAYDITGNFLLAGGDGGYLVKVYAKGEIAGPDRGTVADAIASISTGTRSLFLSQRRFSGQRLWTFDGTDFHEVDTDSMTVLRTIAGSSWAGVTLAGLAFDAQARAFWSRHSATSMKELFIERYGNDDITVGAVVGDICLAAGLEADEFDVDDLDDVCTGYAITSKGTARAALEPLMDAFLIDARETDGVLEFLHRGGASVVTIPEEDLGAGDVGASLPELVEEEITEEQLLPRSVEVTYLSADRAYDEMTQHDRRRADITIAQGEVSLSLPLVLSDDQARQLAQNLLYAAWTERRTYQLSLPASYLRLDPADIVTIPVGGESVRVRLVAVELGANHLVRAAGVLDDLSSYSSSLAGVAGATVFSAVKHLPNSVGFVMDMNLARDGDDNAGFYFAACPDGDDENWAGATLFVSYDGVTFLPLATTTEPATIGVLEGALPKTGGTLDVDWDTTVDVLLTYGTLTSLTEDAVIADSTANLAAIGNETQGWELLQFVEAEDLGGDRWRLSGLLRGRRGTESYMSTHTLDGLASAFVLMDFAGGTIRRVVPQDSEIGQTRRYKIATATTSLSAAEPREITYEAFGLKPYSPVELSAVLSGSDWILHWQRRTRVGGNLQSSSGAALGEDEELYEVDITDSTGGATVVARTLEVSGASTEGVDLSIDGTTERIERLTGSFVTDGYLPGMWIRTEGFSTSANNGDFQIVSVSALYLELDGDLTTEASASGRSIYAISSAVRYTLADQEEDFPGLAPIESVGWNVYQLSARVGRGYVAGIAGGPGS